MRYLMLYVFMVAKNSFAQLPPGQDEFIVGYVNRPNSTYKLKVKPEDNKSVFDKYYNFVPLENSAYNEIAGDALVRLNAVWDVASNTRNGTPILRSVPVSVL